MICYEKWDTEALERIRALDIEPKELKRTLCAIQLVPNVEFDGRFMVRYSTKRGDSKGRLYGNLASLLTVNEPVMYNNHGTSIQGMAKWVRHFITHKYYRDFDVSNAAPNLMEQILRCYSLCPVALTNYNKNRSVLFDRYSRQYGIPRNEVKKVFIALLHTGKGDPRFPESMALKQQLDIALRQLLRRPEYATLYKSMSKRPNALGSFAFNVWAREEQTVLMQMREFFVKLGYKREYMVLCFDGLMIEKDEVLDRIPIDLTSLSTHIRETTGYVLDIEEKSLVPSVEDLALLESFLPK